MFDKFKQIGELNKMRQQASALQKELEKIIETIEKNGWSNKAMSRLYTQVFC